MSNRISLDGDEDVRSGIILPMNIVIIGFRVGTASCFILLFADIKKEKKIYNFYFYRIISLSKYVSCGLCEAWPPG